ncbi:MAG: amino acid ABC transporter permease [Alphaproteobacteria bacterium]
MQTFVRTEMLTPQAPPVTERGVVKWLRENLFSSALNIGLTLLGIATLYYVVTLSLPWLLNGVWTASSLTECRSIIAQNAGPDASGACWAIIHARWYQFIYGFYPPELYWRPVLAFGLLLVALAPILFGDNARNAGLLVSIVSALTILSLFLVNMPMWLFLALSAGLILASYLAYTRLNLLWYLTLLYPFLTVWLLWGGSLWGQVSIMAGFGVLVAAYRLLSPRLGVPIATGIGVVAAVLWWLLLDDKVAEAMQHLIPLAITPIESDKMGGFLLAFIIGVSSISLSLPIGILLALGRQSDMFLVKALSVGFIEFVRGVPLITMLFTASLLLQYFLPPNTNFDLILRVVILVTLFSAAYNAEVVRGGLAALPKGQYEAADALGLDYWQAQRLIIMPQALKVSIPGIVSTFIGLFKDTTLVTFVGLAEPLRGITTIVRADINWKGVYWEPYLFVGAIFFVVCYGMSRYSLYLEGKLRTDHN